MSNRLPNIHPGEILLEEFLQPMGISQYRLAQETGISPMRISEVVRGKRSVTADTALRLARYFGTSVKFWMGLQDDYEIEQARLILADRLEHEVHPLAA
jgi:addiction module HigA family antidote